ncbi:MAG TPA: glucoamylase family protein [Tepidisphaeraceae bacterium]|nr:glucoamylase family protein [Tepidisphaeraceae bacterium]
MRRKSYIVNSARKYAFESLEGRLLLSAISPQSYFVDQDIGSPAQAGSLAYSNGVYTVNAGGAGIGGSSDQFNFASTSISGGFSIIANVASLANTNAGAAAGVMIRNDTSADSGFVALLVTPSDGIELASRSSDGGVLSTSSISGVAAPQFVELTLSSGSISVLYSSNGVTWNATFGSVSVTLGSSALAGLAATSSNNSALTTATFSSVTILPAGFGDADIGSPAVPGSGDYASSLNEFLVSGNGSGIGGTSDQFNFTSRALTGGGSVTALLDGQSSGNPAAEAGVMIRDTGAAGAIEASLLETVGGNLVFAWRTTTGGAVSQATAAAPAGPVWLQLVQQGGSIGAFESTNDVAWTQLGATESITMTGATALAGLAVSSGDSSSLNSAQFSDLSVQQIGWSDTDIGSPALGGSSVYDNPSSTSTIFASGAGLGGTSDSFNFDSTPMSGNGSILAYVNSIASTSAGAEAGLMLRNSDAANSPFVAVIMSLGGGVAFEWRATAGGAVVGQEVGEGTLVAPLGLKLTRSGNTFAAYYSPDGINWDSVGSSAVIAISPTALAGLAVSAASDGTPATAAFSSVGVGASPPPGAGIYSTYDELFLNNLEQAEFNDFYDEANPTSGLVPDNNSASGGGDSADSSIAADGFDLTALTIGDARGWVSHSAAYQRALTTINFLYNSGASMDGYFFHFLNPTTGANYGGSELSSVDTSELMAGVLSVANYWAGTPLQTAALQLYDRVDWPFMQEKNGQFYGAYIPGSGFSGGYGDFSEAALLYLEAVGSPTYPVAPTSWDAWTRTPVVSYDGYSFVTADDGALFTVQYPQAWFNLQGEIDNTSFNFYSNSITATEAQRQMFINLSSEYSDYGPNMWGLTPSEGPSGYTVWGGPPQSDFNGADGAVVPTAPGGSLEFTPRYSLSDLENMYNLYGSTVYRKYGFVDAFNPLTGWTSPLVLGIDVGMTLVSAENSRTDLVWNTYMGNSAAQQATEIAGFHAAADSTNYVVNTTAYPTGGSGRLSLGQAIADADANTQFGTQVIDFAEGISGTINLTGALPAITGNIVIIGPSGVSLTINGSAALGDMLTINSGVTATISNLNFTGGAIGNSGTLVITGNVTVPQITGPGNLTIGSTASDPTLQLTTGGGESQQNSLTIDTGSTLDLTNNTLLIDYAGNPDPMATILSYIRTAYAGGLWNGAGLTSSTVEAEPPSTYALGYSDGADGLGIVPSGQIEIMPTLLGDAKLQGNVVFGDFQLLAQYFGQTGGWDEGAFNYGSTVSFGDFQLLAQNFGDTSAISASVSPASANHAASDQTPAADQLPDSVADDLLFDGSAGILS